MGHGERGSQRTLLYWPAGDGVAEHINPNLDVLVVVIAGSGVVSVDGHEHAVCAGQLLLVHKKASRAIHSGPGGLRYLSIHRRRPALQIEPTARD